VKLRAFILTVFLMLPAGASVVKTFDGKTFEGEIKLERSGELTVIQRTGAMARVELANILLAQFKAQAGEAAGPGRWTGRDIGEVAVPGSAGFAGNAITVKASGAGLSADKDSGYFVYQRMVGDGQIVARVTAIQETNKQALAGVMIRASLESNSAYAMALARAGDRASFHYRARAGVQATSSGGAVGAPPIWVKLARHGARLSAYTSNDGENWDLVALENIILPPATLVGVMVSAHNNNAVCAATFEKITITSGEPRPGDPAAAGQALRGVVLRDGTTVSGQVRSISESAVRLYREREHEISVPLTEVARILFGGVSRDRRAKIEPGRTGVLLSNGDFFEGTLQGLEGDRVKISSVLFGLRKFEAGQTVAAVLRDVTSAAAKYEVRLVDGAVLYTDEVGVERDALVVKTKVGNLTLQLAELAEIKAGANRFKSMADLKPISVRQGGALLGGGLPGFAVDATTAGVPMSLGGQRCERGIGLSAGTSVSYDLGGEYRALMLRLGVPDGVLPAGGVRFTIKADGKDVYLSPERTSLDEPLSVTLSIVNVKTLELLLQSASAGKLGGCGLIGDPALVR
jgi:hypothetical protein